MKDSEPLSEDKTAHGIALKFAEIFQDNYPKKPLWQMMDDLRKDIENYAQFKSKDYRPSLSKDTLYQKVHEALNSFRLSYTYDEDREGLQLVDRLTPPQDETVTRGLQEIEYLTDHIVGEITDWKDYIPEPDGFSIEDMRAAFYAGKDHTADEYRDGQSIGFDEWISTRKPS